MKARWVFGSAIAICAVCLTVRAIDVDQADPKRTTSAVEETKRVAEERKRQEDRQRKEEEERKKVVAAQRTPRVVMGKIEWPKEVEKPKVSPLKKDEKAIKRLAAVKTETQPKAQPPKGQETPPQATIKGHEYAAPPRVPGQVAKPGIVATATAGGGGSPGAGGYGIVADFDCDVEFYLDAMRDRGARVMLYEAGRRKFFALDAFAEEVPEGYSATSRRLTQDYPDGREIIDRARVRLGAGRYEIILLLPGWLEDKFQQGLRQAAVNSVGAGKLPKVTSFHLVYRKAGGDLNIEVERILVDGASVSTRERFTL